MKFNNSNHLNYLVSDEASPIKRTLKFIVQNIDKLREQVSLKFAELDERLNSFNQEITQMKDQIIRMEKGAAQSTQTDLKGLNEKVSILEKKLEDLVQQSKSSIERTITPQKVNPDIPTPISHHSIPSTPVPERKTESVAPKPAPITASIPPAPTKSSSIPKPTASVPVSPPLSRTIPSPQTVPSKETSTQKSPEKTELPEVPTTDKDNEELLKALEKLDSI